jgi:hypothetical protein
MAERAPETRRDAPDLARLYSEAFALALAMDRCDLVEALLESIARMLPGFGRPMGPLPWAGTSGPSDARLA